MRFATVRRYAERRNSETKTTTQYGIQKHRYRHFLCIGQASKIRSRVL